MLENIPEPDQKAIAARIRPEAERAVRSGHPWVYSDSIVDLSRKGKSGDIVVLFDRKNRFLAAGLLDQDSSIAVRVLQFSEPSDIDKSWFRKKIQQAADRRDVLSHSPNNRTNAYRLVHGENDGLPGLVIDRYAASLVLKVYTSAWIPHLTGILPILEEIQPAERVVLRAGRGAAGKIQDTFGVHDGEILLGPELNEPVLFLENGLSFEADLINGQKTGFFLDQRENRARLERMSNGKSVLNLFSYSGGFSVYAARGGARSVTDVDTCTESNSASRRNMARNKHLFSSNPPEHTIHEMDVFDALSKMAAKHRSFDVVIADPPAFANNNKQVELALKNYARLTRECLHVLKPGGILVQASCSSPVESNSFFQTVIEACRKSNRNLTEITRTGHALDHPIGFKEGSYLKCLYAIID